MPARSGTRWRTCRPGWPPSKPRSTRSRPSARAAMPFDAGRVLIVLVAAASFWQPARGVLLLAVLAPMSAVAAFRSSSPVQLADALALGFLAGWIVRRHRPVRGPAFPALAVSAMCALGLFALI